MKQLAIDQFMNYKFLSELKFAPGGKQAALVVAQADKDKNSYRSSIWLYKGGKFSVLTGLQKEKGYIWEDETHILFPAVRSEAEKEKAQSGDRSTTYYRLSTEGGEAQPAFTLPFTAVGLKKYDDETWIVSGAIDANHPDYYKMSAEERANLQKTYKENTDYEVFTEIPFYGNGEGFTDKQRLALFLFTPADGKIKRITDPLMTAVDPQVLDGKIYYNALKCDDVINYFDFRPYVYDKKTGRTKQLVKSKTLSCDSLFILNDKLMALMSEISVNHISAESKFYEIDTKTGALTLFADNMDSLDNSTGSDCRLGHGTSLQVQNGEVYFTKTLRNDAILCKLSVDGSISNVIEKAGSVDDFAVSESGKILTIGMFDNKLQEVYEAGKNVKKVSSFNDEVLADTYVADYQKLTIESEGWDIDGWVLLPKDYDPKKKYPAILDIHGGPRTVYGEIFYHEMQLWANMGYFVMFCNPVGGSGRGQKFADITDAYGTIDFKNIMDFVDAVLDKYPQIDRKRVGCTGGSYGGFMSNWILGHTDRFACVATQRSISNWISFHGTSDIGFFFTPNQLGYDIYSDEGIEHLWRQSPIKYINNMVTPTLFIHSDEDYRCPMEQGLQLFTALKKKGVPARFVYFKGENHELSRSGKPLHRLKRLQEITDWMEKYCK